MVHNMKTLFQTYVILWILGDFLFMASAERQEMKAGFSVWRLPDGGQRRCHPVSFCAIDHEVRPCLVGGQQDRCMKCPAGKINMDATSSWSCFPCYSEPSCPEGTIKNPNPSPSSSSCNPRCQCDPRQGWYGPDSCRCTMADNICANNTYLNTNGHCTACPEGTHKPGLGYGPCLKVTKSTTDPQTLSPMSTTTTTGSSSMSDSSDEIDQSAVIEPHPKKESEKRVLSNQDEVKMLGNPETQHSLTIAIAAMCVFIICLGFAGFGLLYRHISADSGPVGPQAQLMPGENDSSDANRSQASSVDGFSPPTLGTETGSSTSPLITPVSDPDLTHPKQRLAIEDA